MAVTGAFRPLFGVTAAADRVSKVVCRRLELCGAYGTLSLPARMLITATVCLINFQLAFAGTKFNVRLCLASLFSFFFLGFWSVRNEAVHFLHVMRPFTNPIQCYFFKKKKKNRKN